MFKQEIIKVIAKQTGLRKEEIEKALEIPPNFELGDYAFPCFILSKKLKKSPNEIADELKKRLINKKMPELEKIESKNGYLNFFIDKKKLAEQILRINANYGRQNIGRRKKIIIEFSQPNIGKPMHVGHIRSTILGDSLMRIYDFLNYYPLGINYLGDVGLHIGKLITAYEIWLDKEALEKNPIQELLRLYVKFCSKEKSEITEGVDEEFQDNEWTAKAKEKLRLLELGDKKTHKIWNDIRKYSGKSFNKIYDILKINFTETIGQSHFSEKGKSIVLEALKRGFAKKENDGAVYIEFEESGRNTDKKKKYILRSNQTASYITQDLGAAVERYKKYRFDKMIYVVDFRQSDHFYSLFKILKMLNYDFVDKCYHLKFGTVRFGDEIFATRFGKIILLEEVIKKTIEKAKQEIKKRKTKGDSEKVGVGAVKYAFLKNEPIKEVSFSWEILNFEGNTGPYLQYSYARASSIIRKSKDEKDKKQTKKSKTIKKIEIPNQLTSHEIYLLLKIDKFPEIIEAAGKSLNPSIIANYSFELAKSFNEFYHSCKVIGDENEVFRLKLVDSFRTTLKNSLHLLGIEVMEEM
ncbi:MAG: arginine--tRNA ligase [Nanoarchaeota archaeon]